jgi:hypothetical protein
MIGKHPVLRCAQELKSATGCDANGREQGWCNMRSAVNQKRQPLNFRLLSDA